MKALKLSYFGTQPSCFRVLSLEEPGPGRSSAAPVNLTEPSNAPLARVASIISCKYTVSYSFPSHLLSLEGSNAQLSASGASRGITWGAEESVRCQSREECRWHQTSTDLERDGLSVRPEEDLAPIALSVLTFQHLITTTHPLSRTLQKAQVMDNNCMGKIFDSPECRVLQHPHNESNSRCGRPTEPPRPAGGRRCVLPYITSGK